MASNEPAKGRTAAADSIATTLEWLITAFILAFVFRAFVMEAFRIPTGSMADTLKGHTSGSAALSAAMDMIMVSCPYFTGGPKNTFRLEMLPSGPKGRAARAAVIGSAVM